MSKIWILQHGMYINFQCILFPKNREGELNETQLWAWLSEKKKKKSTISMGLPSHLSSILCIGEI